MSSAAFSELLLQIGSVAGVAFIAFVWSFALGILLCCDGLGTPGGHYVLVGVLNIHQFGTFLVSIAIGAMVRTLERFWNGLRGHALGLRIVEARGPRKAWQAQATPRVDVAEVPNRFCPGAQTKRRHGGFSGWLTWVGFGSLIARSHSFRIGLGWHVVWMFRGPFA